MADLSESGCLGRVRRLQESGAIRGYHADVDAAAFGAHLEAWVSVRLARHTRKAVASFEMKAMAEEHVLELHHLTGRVDYLMRVVAADMDDLRNFTMDALTRLPEVSQVETALIFQSRITRVLPDLTGRSEH